MSFDASPPRCAALAAAVAMLVALVLVPSIALAHTSLVSSTPVDREELTVAPDHVVLEFAEPVAADEESVSVVDPDGVDRVDSVLVSANGRVVSAVLELESPRGAWEVAYRVRGADGHQVSGRLDFTVGADVSWRVGGLQPVSAAAVVLLAAAGGFAVLVPRQPRAERTRERAR